MFKPWDSLTDCFDCMWPQVTVPLSHLINVLHSMKSSVGCGGTTCSPRKHKKCASDSELHCTEVFLINDYNKWNSRGIWIITIQNMLWCVYVQPMLNLRELGLSDLGAQQLDELVNHVLPRRSPQKAPLPLSGQTAWRTSHISTHSFLYNKHGENERLCYKHSSWTLYNLNRCGYGWCPQLLEYCKWLNKSYLSILSVQWSNVIFILHGDFCSILQNYLNFRTPWTPHNRTCPDFKICKKF